VVHERHFGVESGNGKNLMIFCIMIFSSKQSSPLGRHNFMKQQRVERVRNFKGFLVQDHILSMKEVTRNIAKGFVNRERERKVDYIFLLSHHHAVC
jgi:hypothetical protein